MDNRNLINTLYSVQTLLKLAFIPMSLFNLPFTLMAAFAASGIGVYRVCKNPQMSRAYLQKVLMNNHGQNLMWICFSSTGDINYLFYAPIVLFFGYGIAEYIKINYANTQYIGYVDLVRNSKSTIFKTKGILQIILCIYLLATVFFNVFGRLLKVFLIGQLLMMKYKVNTEFRSAAGEVHQWILVKTQGVEILYTNYIKLSNWLYGYATRGMQ